MFEVKEDLTTDNILSRISDYDIFSFYCKPFKAIGRKFCSELRDEKKPSAYINSYDGKLWYKDFGENEHSSDCFSYVMRKYNVTFHQALDIINCDFRLGLKNHIEYPASLNYLGFPDKKRYKPVEKQPLTIIPTYRNWMELDLNFWKKRYYLDIPRLEFFEIAPCKAITLVYPDGREKYIELEVPSYCYYIDKEKGHKFYKIYTPYSSNFKWVGNCLAHHYQGFNQLPWIGESIIITKSLKDVAVLSLFGYSAIAPSSESQVISYEKYIQLKKRFDTIFVFYDNDAGGISGSKRTVEVYNDIIPISISVNSGVKDISDYVEKYRFTATKKLLGQLIDMRGGM